MPTLYRRFPYVARVALVAVVTFAALWGMTAPVLADEPTEESYTPISTFADHVYLGGVCGISYRLIFDADGQALTVRAGSGGLDTDSMRRGAARTVRGTTIQAWARLNGELVEKAVYIDSAAGDFVDTGHVYQLMYGTFDDATGRTATLSFQLYDFRPGGEICTDTLHVSRS